MYWEYYMILMVVSTLWNWVWCPFWPRLIYLAPHTGIWAPACWHVTENAASVSRIHTPAPLPWLLRSTDKLKCVVVKTQSLKFSLMQSVIVSLIKSNQWSILMVTKCRDQIHSELHSSAHLTIVFNITCHRGVLQLNIIFDPSQSSFTEVIEYTVDD